MPTYQAPVDDYKFILHEMLRVQDRHDLPGFSQLTVEFCSQLLDSAARFHEEVLLPVGAKGDAQGARLVDGRVRTPDVYREAWSAYREAGWLGVSLPEQIGGAGLPALVSSAINEMRLATAQSLHMYFGFCISASRMLLEAGEPWMREKVAPKLASGEWTATMSLTESHCGSDLRQIRTRAIPQPDGTWRIEGGKIFISGGDHDLAENIVHVVLAKMPDASGAYPLDLSAVGVFLVPKLEIDPQTGKAGAPNHVYVDAIEHKMGIEGNATCVMRFDGAKAWPIGGGDATSASARMAPMFLLMNYARVGTALSGVAYAEIAVQNATEYARERLVGRLPGGAKAPDLPGDPLICHPDIRRLLLGARAFAEGARATAMRVSVWQQEAESLEAGDRRETSRDLMELMTPVMKAFFTDQGFARVNDCLQVLGGHGYVRDHGLEQMVRNVRVTQLYEGANGIQAIDLVQRKLPARDWRGARTLTGQLRSFLEKHANRPALASFVPALRRAAEDLDAVFGLLQQRARQGGPGANLPVAYDVLELCGTAMLGWSWAEAVATIDHGADISPSLRRRKLACASYWFEREMPHTSLLRNRIEAGFTLVSQLDCADF